MNIKDNNMMNNMKMEKSKQKINVLFEATNGFKKLIKVDWGTYICDMIKKFLNEIGKPELFGSEKIYFMYNSYKSNLYDNSKVENLIPEASTHQKIVVYDGLNTIGG